MKDDLIRRISEALDSAEGLEGDVALQRMLAQDPAASDIADDMARTDAALRAWPAPVISDKAFEALAVRVEQRLSEDLPPVADPTEPPPFEEAEAGPDAVPDIPPPPRLPTTSSGEFSLSNLARLSVRDVAAAGPPARIVAAPQPTRPLPPRTDERFSISDLRVRPPAVRGLELDDILAPVPPAPAPARPGRAGWWVAGSLAAAAVLGIAVVTGLNLTSHEEPTVAMAPAEEGRAGVVPDTAPIQGVAEPEVERLPEEPQAGAPEGQAADDESSPAEEHSATAAQPAQAEAARVDSDAPRSPRNVAEPAAPTSREQQRERRQAQQGAGGVDSLIDRAVTQMQSAAPSERPPAVASTGSGSLPETPSRDAVIAAMRAVQPAVRACAQGDRHGVATVRIVIGSSGRVRNAEVVGDFAGTSEGSCVARAVRGASVPPFSSASFAVTYPFPI